MKNHYLPQFLLRGFVGASGLWQFDIHTGEFEPRAPDNAGQRRHFYPKELETGLLQLVDGESGGIFATGLIGSRGEIRVGDEEKLLLARWIALFCIRGPQTFENFKEHVSQAHQPESIRELLLKGRDRVLEIIRARHPDLYDRTLADFGKHTAENVILDAVVHRILKHEIALPLDAKKSFGDFINEERVEAYASRLIPMQWVWLETRQQFILGDNPLCRWSKRTGGWNHGLDQKDIEITIPLSQRICLRLQRPQSRADRVVHCDEAMTREYNRRQAVSSVYNIYGPETTLRPLVARYVKDALKNGRLATAPRFRP